MQIFTMVGGAAFLLVAGGVFVLQQLSRTSKPAFTADQAHQLDQEVNDWLQRYKTDQG